ncbi:hypothetical protein AAHC03_01980 [Spirometra sp. Aus1]
MILQPQRNNLQCVWPPISRHCLLAMWRRHWVVISESVILLMLVKIILTVFIANFEIGGDFLKPTEHRSSSSSQCLNWSGRLQGYLDNLTLSNCSHWRPDLLKSSIIIVTHNEPLTTLISTIESIESNTSKVLLQEIIIVDDSSEEPVSLDDLKSTTLIRIIRNSNREGLIRSRLIGARQAKGDVLVFLDSHVRVSEDWLTFLLLRLALHHLKQTTPAEDKVCQAALSHTPYARLPAKFLLLSPAINELSVTGVEYPASEALRGGFDWDLTFTWEAVSEEEKERVRELDAAAGHWRFAARPTPSIAGCAFALLRREFFRLGGLDEGMQIWGGENLELSLRTWQCGGRVEIVPCSRVAHLFRVQHPYRFPEGRQTTITRNLKRVAKVWMQPAEEISMRDGLLVLPLALFFASRPSALSIGTGDLTGRENLKRDLQCRNFSWFLQSVYPELQMKAQSVDLFDAAVIAARIANNRAP